MLNTQSPAFHAYIEKRVAEKTAGVIKYAEDIAKNYLQNAAGVELSKEAAEEVKHTTLVPFVIQALINS